MAAHSNTAAIQDWPDSFRMLGTAIDPKPPAANREHLKVHIPKPQTGPTLEGFMRKIAFKLLTLATIFATAGLDTCAN
jgi:hypothetical protein